MKKFLCCFMALVFVFGLTCCVEDVPTKEPASSTTSTNAESDKFGLNETAVFKDLKITATELKESDGDGFFVPEEGNVFVGVKFAIENISDEEQSVSSLMMFEAYLEDVKCEYSISAACVFDEGTLDGSISAGKKLIGWYAIEVPKNWNEIEIQVLPSMFSNNKATFIFDK